MQARAVACLLVGVVLIAGCSGQTKGVSGAAEARATSSPTFVSDDHHSPRDNALLDEFFYSATQGGLQSLDSRISYGSITDRELIDGAESFCAALRSRAASVGGVVTPGTFDAAVVETSKRFAGKVETTTGEIAKTGPTRLTKALGVAAVHKLCPDLSRALG
jgi:hypothetical protein